MDILDSLFFEVLDGEGFEHVGGVVEVGIGGDAVLKKLGFGFVEDRTGAEGHKFGAVGVEDSEEEFVGPGAERLLKVVDVTFQCEVGGNGKVVGEAVVAGVLAEEADGLVAEDFFGDDFGNKGIVGTGAVFCIRSVEGAFDAKLTEVVARLFQLMDVEEVGGRQLTVDVSSLPGIETEDVIDGFPVSKFYYFKTKDFAFSCEFFYLHHRVL